MLDVLADPAVSDADAGRLVRARIGMPRLQAAPRPTAEREPRDHGHFDLLAARYKYLRTFTPAVIAALPLTGNTASPDVAALLDAVDVLSWKPLRPSMISSNAPRCCCCVGAVPAAARSPD